MARVVVGTCPGCGAKLRMKESAVQPTLHLTCGRCRWSGPVTPPPEVLLVAEQTRQKLRGGLSESLVEGIFRVGAVALAVGFLFPTLSLWLYEGGLFDTTSVVGRTTTHHVAAWYLVLLVASGLLFAGYFWMLVLLAFWNWLRPGKTATGSAEARNWLLGGLLVATVISLVVGWAYGTMFPSTLDQVRVTDDSFEVWTHAPSSFAGISRRIEFKDIYEVSNPQDADSPPALRLAVPEQVRELTRPEFAVAWEDRATGHTASVEEPKRLLRHAFEDIRARCKDWEEQHRADTADYEVRREQRSLQGTWVDYSHGPDPDTLTFAGDHLQVRRVAFRPTAFRVMPERVVVTEEYTYTVDPAADPRRIDLDKGQGKRLLGIYKFGADPFGSPLLLILLNGEQRPSTWSTTEESEAIRYSLMKDLGSGR